jgi:hypothetical protein
MRRVLAAAAAAVLLAGCSSDGPDADGLATLERVCDPHDATAVEVIVPAGRSDYPRLRVVVRRYDVEGTTVTVPGPDGQAGTAAWCRTSADCQTLSSATVGFGVTQPDASIDVSVDAPLPDGTRFVAARRAQWQGTPTLCI